MVAEILNEYDCGVDATPITVDSRLGKRLMHYWFQCGEIGQRKRRI